jgi:hypothetical protein
MGDNVREMGGYVREMGGYVREMEAMLERWRPCKRDGWPNYTLERLIA